MARSSRFCPEPQDSLGGAQTSLDPSFTEYDRIGVCPVVCLAISWVRMQRPGLTELPRDRVDPRSRELKALSCRSWASPVGEREKAHMNPK